jgi:hypothetical protein
MRGSRDMRGSTGNVARTFASPWILAKPAGVALLGAASRAFPGSDGRLRQAAHAHISKLSHARNWCGLAEDASFKPRVLADMLGVSLRTLEVFFKRRTGESVRLG